MRIRSWGNLGYKKEKEERKAKWDEVNFRNLNPMSYSILVISALGELRQGDQNYHEFESNLGYIVRPWLIKTKTLKKYLFVWLLMYLFIHHLYTWANFCLDACTKFRGQLAEVDPSRVSQESTLGSNLLHLVGHLASATHFPIQCVINILQSFCILRRGFL